MNKLVFAAALALLLLASTCSTPKNGAQGAASTPPNILFLLTDDQRWDMLGIMGNPIIQTPNIDRLGQQGVVFDRAYVTTSICSVSRASILSGQYGRRHGLWGFGQGFSDTAFAQAFPMLLKQAGYHTGYIGKYGVGPIRMPSEEFDYWGGFDHQGTFHHRDSLGNYLHLTKKIEGQAIEYLRTRDKEKPFVLSIGFKAPHVEDGAPPDPAKLFPADPAYDQTYTDAVWPLPAAADPAYFDYFPPIFTEGNEARKRWEVRFSTPERYDASLKGYYRLVHGVDVAVGEILKELERQGLAENTIVIFHSDNGFYLGEYGFAGKWYGSEPSVRVPLIVYDPRPGAPRGIRRDELALNIDIAPTILAYAGVPIPARMQGRDLTQLFGKKTPAWREDFFYEHLWPLNTGYNIPSTEGVIGRRYKYMRYFNGFEPAEILFEEAYDMDADPHELNNLLSDPGFQDRLRQLRERTEVYREETR